MGGRRSEQHGIGPDEGLSTDRKTRPGDEHIMTEDKQKYESTKKQGQSRHIPERKLNPALQQVRDKNDVRGE